MAEPEYACISAAPVKIVNFNFSDILKYTNVINDAHHIHNNFTDVIIKAQSLFAEHFVTGIMFVDKPADDVNDFFFKARVKAYMRKTVVYRVTCRISKSNTVKTATCECPGGVSPACCKHAFALLVALEDYSRKELFSAPTERIQEWHHPRAAKVSIEKYRSTRTEREIIKWPHSPPVLTVLPQTLCMFQLNFNTMQTDNILFCDNLFYQKTMPLPHFKYFYISLYVPPDEIDLNSLLYYHSDVRKTIFDVQNLEKCTMSQSTPQWMQERRKRLTASRIWDVLFAKNDDALLNSMLETRDISHLPPIRLGKSLEPLVKNSIKSKFSNHIFRNIGLVVHPKFPFLAASPDGLLYNIDDPMLVEVKVIFNLKHLSLEQLCKQRKSFCLSYNQDTQQFKLKKTHKYYFQIQFQLFCSNIPKCLFSLFSDYHRPLHMETIEADTTLWDDKLDRLAKFYFIKYLPEFLKKSDS